MKYILIFNISHNEDMPYEKVYEILEKEFGLYKYEMQEERKVLTPTTTVIGDNEKYKSSEALCEGVRDRLYEEDVIFDRLLVVKADNYQLLG